MKASTVASLIVVSTWAHCAALADGGINALAAAKGKYEKAKGEIEKERTEKHRQVLDGYRHALTNFAEQIKTEGKLDEYLVTQKELARLNKESSVPDKLPPSLPPSVARLHQHCRDSMRRADVEAIRRSIRLTEKYIVHLKGIVKTLMSGDKIEEAKLTNAESKRADFILADLHSRLRPPKASPASRGVHNKDVGARRSPTPKSFQLIARIRTGHRKNDGTGSPVYIIINEDDSLKRRLPEDPKVGTEQTFAFTFDYPVSRVESITVQIEGGDAWRAQGFAFQIVHGDQRTEMRTFGGGYFSDEREGGPTVVRKTFEFKPVIPGDRRLIR